MDAIKRWFINCTPTRSLVISSGKYETLFFESVYRYTYFIGLARNEITWSYFVYGSAVKITLFFLMIGEIAYGFLDDISIDDRVSNINTYLLQILCLYRYMNMIANQHLYKDLVAFMESPYFDTSTPQRQMLVEYWAKKNDKFLKILVGLGNFTLFTWCISPLLDDVEYNIMIHVYIPFSYNTPTLFLCVYITLVIAFWYIANFIMNVDITMQAHLIQLVCQLAVLRDCFENLLEDCRIGFEGIHPNYLIYNNEFTKKYTKRMGELVEQHKLILSYTMDLRNSLSRPMLFQFMISGTLICFVGFETITTLTENYAKTISGLFFLGFNVFSLFIICRWCDEIKVQSLNIGEAIYCCGWESGLSTLPGVKQTVKLVIARAHKPLAFTAGGMYGLTLASFSNLVKTSYSGLTVVLRMKYD